jgi:hypothetical protein
MLGVIGAMLGALLAGCTAHKHPSREETGLANVAKDVVIPSEAGEKEPGSMDRWLNYSRSRCTLIGLRKLFL